MLVLNNLQKKFTNSKMVLNNVNAKFRSGSINCIVGVNGAGKTTLLKDGCFTDKRKAQSFNQTTLETWLLESQKEVIPYEEK
ncbi:TPA: ATP-binding cassette domain-containing protein [Staphylococcus aureus]